MKTPPTARIAVLGASPKSSRYSHRAVHELKAHGFAEIVPVHPLTPTIAGIRAVATIADVPTPIHTITMYVNAAVSTPMIAEIVGRAPARIVFNPGAENAALASAATAAGIAVVHGCTLVMLAAGQF